MLAETRAAPVPEPGQRARAVIRTLALVASASTLAVIVASAFLRHAQAGLSCADWPACYARVGGIVDAPGIAFARTLHRVSATAVSLAVLAMLALAVATRDRHARRSSFVAAAIVAALAGLGVLTPGARVPAVPLANLLGGFALLAVLAATHARAAPGDTIDATSRSLASATLAVIFVQAALGGLISTQFALLACPSFPSCTDASLHGILESVRHVFPPVVQHDGAIVALSGAAALHVAHRVNGVLLVALVIATAARLWRPRGLLAAALFIVLGIGAFAGMAAALVPSALAVAVIHNAAAAVLAALLASAAADRPGSFD